MVWCQRLLWCLRCVSWGDGEGQGCTEGLCTPSPQLYSSNLCTGVPRKIDLKGEGSPLLIKA